MRGKPFTEEQVSVRNLVVLEGQIIHGLQKAASYLRDQIPLITGEFPEIARCHRGSINLELNVPLLVIGSDHRTKPIAWKPGVTEVFDFVRPELEAPMDSPPVPAWLYIAHLSSLRRTPFVHELITQRLELDGVTRCRIKIRRPAIQIHWSLFPAVVVL